MIVCLPYWKVGLVEKYFARRNCGNGCSDLTYINIYRQLFGVQV